MRPVHTSASTQSHFWLSASLPCLGISSTNGSVPCFAIDRTHPPSWLAFAPPALPGFFATMQPLTSVSQLPDLLTDLLASRHLNFPPFRLQPPQGASRCLYHVTHQALEREGFSPHIRVSPFPSRLTASFRPNRVRHPTDWWFSFCCFPPHLTVTQLQSDTGRRTSAR